MNKFWRVYSWIYLGAVLFGIFYHYFIEPVKVTIEVSKIQYTIAYILVSMLSLIPVAGLFLYSFNKRKVMFFWKLYSLYFVYALINMFVEGYRIGMLAFLLPFHTVALTGLLLYSFTKK